ncbi:MAG: beta-class carbonic anhydrase [Aeromicrobium sp.]
MNGCAPRSRQDPRHRCSDAHVIRNAGGVVTEDAVRSLAISQRLLGTEEIVLVHHTDCGMLTFADDEFRQGIETETGIRPSWVAESFPDVAGDVRQGINRIKARSLHPSHGAGSWLRPRRRHRGDRRGRRGLSAASADPRRTDHGRPGPT